MREELDPITTVVGVDTYELDRPYSELQITRIMSVRINDMPLRAVIEDDAQYMRPSSGTPVRFTTNRLDNVFSIRLHPTPDAAVSVVINAALRPTIAAENLPDDLFDIWDGAIIEGALSKIYSIPGQAFTDYAHAGAMAASASRKAAAARTESYYGRMRGNLSVRKRSF